jgi:acetylornithine/N-succinyldiaminopimelate aminotransferase
MTDLDELWRLDQRYVLPTYARMPVAFVRGEGARLWDAEGVEYLDFLAGVAVANTGHCHPRVVEAIREQAGQLLHVSNLAYTEPQLRLAEALSERSLGGRVFFCNSGAEAVEGALKLARKARRGGEIVSVHGAFHGRTYGALSATPQEAKQEPFAPLVGGFRAVPPTAEAIREAVSGSTAALLLEVVQGESGVHPLGDEVLRAAREACDATGALLIFDEVQTGMGRTGTLWAWEQAPVRPDVMTVAKGLGGGLPIGAVVTAPAYGDGLAPGDHGSTFAGGPVPTSAALAALEVLSDPRLLARVRDLGERLLAGLAELPGATEVRGRGLMCAFDLAAGEGAPDLVRRALTEQRLVLNATGPATVRLIPPLIVDEADVDEAVTRLHALL